MGKKKPLDIGIPPEVAREMYLFFLRTSAPRIAAQIREEEQSAEENQEGNEDN